MKDQYFGDINDYRKYGLIRSVLRSYQFRLLVAWMLTPDDASSDGKFTDYFSKPTQWSRHDSELYEELQCLMNQKDKREIALIENTNLLPGARYFSRIVPDSYDDRFSWSQELLSRADGCDLVFLDPDNGLEVKSKPYGRKDSSKYLYLREVDSLWAQGKSLLIYQHFCRVKRPLFIEHMKHILQGSTKGSLVSAFATSHVVFFLALQPEHQIHHSIIAADVHSNWDTQIRRVGRFNNGDKAMTNEKPVRYFINPGSLPDRFPSHKHEPSFWESLGRAVATFGFLEEVLGKAIFSFTATRPYKETEIQQAYSKWLPKLEHALIDPLGNLIDVYGKAVRDHPGAEIDYFNDLLDDLREASQIRNVLCHGSWRLPDTNGASIPFFVNRQKEIFNSALDRQSIDQVQRHAANLECAVINTVTQMGWQFPGSAGPGKTISYESSFS